MAVGLFEDSPEARLLREALGPGTAILKGFALGLEAELVSALEAVVEGAPVLVNHAKDLDKCGWKSNDRF